MEKWRYYLFWSYDMRLDNKKRKDIRKDCEKFWLMDILEVYRSKLEVNLKPKLTHLVWVVYSDYLLLKKSTHWKCVCVTCGAIKDWYDPTCHPWHYRKAWSSLKHKYNDDNVRPQCFHCNVWLDGNYRNYTLRYINKFGKEAEQAIWSDKETKTYKNFQYAEMIKERFTYLNAHELYTSSNRWSTPLN